MLACLHNIDDFLIGCLLAIAIMHTISIVIGSTLSVINIKRKFDFTENKLSSCYRNTLNQKIIISAVRRRREAIYFDSLQLCELSYLSIRVRRRRVVLLY